MEKSPIQIQELRDQFFSQVQTPLPLLALIDHLPATYFFTKDREGRFVHVNRALLKVLGFTDASEVLGKTDHDFFSPDVATRYRDQSKIPHRDD